MNATSVLLFTSLKSVWPLRVHCLIFIYYVIGGIQAWLYISSFISSGIGGVQAVV